MPSNETERAKLIALLEYLDAWQSAYIEYHDWYTSTFQDRMDRWNTYRDQAAQAIIEATKSLEYGKDGRVRNDTGLARKKIKAFQIYSDKVFARMIAAGRKLFGAQGRYDQDTGMYIGGLDPLVKAAIRKHLKSFYERVTAKVEKAQDKLNAA